MTEEPETPPPRSAVADALRTLLFGAPFVIVFWICCAWIKSHFPAA